MREKGSYRDRLLFLRFRSHRSKIESPAITTMEDVFSFMETFRNVLHLIGFQTEFFKRLVNQLQTRSWVNIEHYYFSRLKNIFRGNDVHGKKHDQVVTLNQDMDFLISQLTAYIEEVNKTLNSYTQQPLLNGRLERLFVPLNNDKIQIVNFNYTETVTQLGYATEHKIIHIHSRITNLRENPIIFGYGDESDPTYQEIEDIGDNVYLDHIKSFGYFQTNNYENLSGFLETEPYQVSILGLSCGLSDRILLREIFEHRHCFRINIFYHESLNGKNNYKEITQEISRHFQANNKAIMRHRVKSFDPENKIPQIN